MPELESLLFTNVIHESKQNTPQHFISFSTGRHKNYKFATNNSVHLLANVTDQL